MNRKLKRTLERVGFALLLAVIRPLPRSAAMSVASALGVFAFDGIRLRRKVSVANVRERLSPAGGYPEAVRIARESYRVMARTFFDLLCIDRIDDDALWRMLSRDEFDAFRRIRETEQGAVLVSGHFGNWELLVLGAARMGIPLRAVAKDQANNVVDAHVKRVRGRAGVPTLSARRGVRAALETVGAGDYVATLLDQDARRKGIFVDFLGAPASSHTGVVAMAVRAGIPLIAGALIDEERGRRYRLVMAEPWRADPEAPEEENLRAAVAHFHRFLQEQVRAHPGNYLWAHRRWKTQPPAPPARAGSAPPPDPEKARS